MGEIGKRHQNRGIRKTCDCPRRNWAKCPHSWQFNFKPKGGQGYRFAVDVEAGRHIALKADAEALADAWRSEIRAGTFRRRTDAVPAVAAPAASPDAMHLEKFIATYTERRAKPLSTNDRICLGRFAAFTLDGCQLRETPIGAFTEDAVEAFFASLNGKAASTRNKYVQAVKALFRWATKKKYLAQNPIADSETIKREQHAKRHRRLVPDRLNDEGALVYAGEERMLLSVAGPHLQRLIIAALESCCRLPELLRLQWRDVDLDRRELTIRAQITKTGEAGARVLPINPRLAGALEMAHTALAMSLFGGETGARLTAQEKADQVAACYVFGDAAGRRMKCVRKAWDTAVLKAHGHAPVWVGGNTLAPESRAALRSIDLLFHDLRHEAGSRLVEAGWPLHHVQQMLGHKSLEQTTTYLNVTRVGLADSMRRFDHAVSRCSPVAVQASIELAPHCNEAIQPKPQHQVN